MITRSNLTSGFLSAIQTFSLETRESEIDYFSSKDEYFLFTPLVGTQMILICVYDKNTDRQLADSLLNEVWSIMLDSHIIKSNTRNEVDQEKNAVLVDKIRNLISIFESEYLIQNAKTIFDRENSISSLRLIDTRSDYRYFEDARPKPLLKENQLIELDLLIAALDKLSERINLPTFDFLIIHCLGGMFTVYRKINLLSVIFSSGIFSSDLILEQSLRLFNLISLEDFNLRYRNNGNSSINLEMNPEGDIISQNGTNLPPMIEIYISSLINAVNRFVSTYIRKEFTEVEIFIPNNESNVVQLRATKGNYLLTVS